MATIVWDVDAGTIIAIFNCVICTWCCLV